MIFYFKVTTWESIEISKHDKKYKEYQKELFEHILSGKIKNIDDFYEYINKKCIREFFHVNTSFESDSISLEDNNYKATIEIEIHDRYDTIKWDNSVFAPKDKINNE